MYWSKFAHVFRYKDFNIVFHSLTLQTVHIEASLTPQAYEELSQTDLDVMEGNTLAQLHEKELVITGKSEDESVNALLHSNEAAIDVKNLNLLISNACNMNCTYCQIENNIFGKKCNMSSSTALSAIVYFEKICNVQDPLTVNFTGGEPLLNFDVIRNVVAYIKQSTKLKRSRLVVFTNGTLVTDEIAEFFKQNDFLVILSLDGASERHNRCRKYPDGTGTYSDALQGYKIAQAAGCSCAISSVADLEDTEFASYLEWLITLRPLSVGLNYPHLILDQLPLEVDIKTYSKQIIEANETLKRAGISLENYNRFSKFFNRKELRRRECQACGRGITVDARGKIGPCKSLLVSDKISFSLNEFDIEKSAAFCEWARRTPLREESCLSCPAVSICGGGCAYDAYCLFEGDALRMDRRLCPHIRNVFFDLLKNRLECSSAEEETRICSANIYDSVGH